MENFSKKLTRKEARKLTRKNKKHQKHNQKYNKTRDSKIVENVKNEINTISKKRKKTNKIIQTKSAKYCELEDNDTLTVKRFEKILNIPEAGNDRFAAFRVDGLEELLEICYNDDLSNLLEEEPTPKVLKVSQDTKPVTDDDSKMKIDKSATYFRKEGLQIIKGKLNSALNRLSKKTTTWVAIQIDELLIVCKDEKASQFLAKCFLEWLLARKDIFLERVILDLSSVLPHILSSSGLIFLRFIISLASRQLFESLSSDQVDEDAPFSYEAHIMLLFLTSCMHFNTISQDCMFEILERVCECVTQRRLECLLLVLKWIGHRLVSINKTRVYALINSIKSNLNLPPNQFTKLVFLAELLESVTQDNGIDLLPEFGCVVATWFFSEPTKATKILINQPLEQILAITENIESPSDLNLASLAGFEFSDGLLAAAARQNLRSQVEKTIFCLVMSSEDFLDAFEKLRRLTINEKVDGQIVSVIVHCCSREREYNPYYAHLLNSLFQFKRDFLIRFKLILGERMEDIGSFSGNLANFADLCVFFVSSGLLSVVSVLKHINFLNIGDRHVQFVSGVIIGLLKSESGMSVFDVMKRTRLVGLRRCLRTFVENYLCDFVDSGLKCSIKDFIKLLSC